MVKMWIVDIACGYDLVSKRETALIRRFVSKAKVPITFHTANRPPRTDNVAHFYVKELDENITPHVIDNTPPVLTVGYRCMELGYTCIWPTNQSPYFIRRRERGSFADHQLTLRQRISRARLAVRKMDRSKSK
jgi:hypothetical protein